MQMHLLVSLEMRYSLPKEIKLLADWEEVNLIVTNDIGISPSYTKGDHIAIEGDKQVIENWLAPFNGVWIGKGSPMMQNFTWTI